uniref:Uncharacterized protein n=1 Tax=Siphoviridae sp. ctDmR33 TaxID=2825389 RepID=A0A8S5UXC9_9CAUD|nr:MAG TPA: hypothetical protein [Siphoviridae sp. ctDmR33]
MKTEQQGAQYTAYTPPIISIRRGKINGGKETMEEKIKAIIEAMDDGDKIALWNEACRECGYSDDEIFYMQDFDEMMEGYSPLDIVQKTYYGKNFEPGDVYFCFDGYANLASFDFADDEGSPFYIDDLVDRIVRNENAFGCDEIAAALNGDEDEDEETEV